MPHWTSPAPRWRLASPRLVPSRHRQGATFLPTPAVSSLEDVVEALAQLEIIEMKGLALSQILENIISTLDSGRLSGPLEEEMNPSP